MGTVSMRHFFREGTESVVLTLGSDCVGVPEKTTGFTPRRPFAGHG